MKLKFLPIKKILVFGTLAFSIQAASAQAQTNVFDNIIATSPTHTSLEAALIKAGLDDDLKTLTNLTVFAPDDASFSAAAAALNTDINGLLALPNLKDILLYHVLGSKVLSTAVTNGLVGSPLSPTNTLKFTKTKDMKVFVNQAQVTTADLNASNGVVHVINSVLLPTETVVDIALDNSGFTTLVTAVVQEELLPALTNPFSKLTVFAPTDAAFLTVATALGTDINGLLALPNLRNILLHHVLGTKFLASAVPDGLFAKPLSVGNTLKFTKTKDAKFFVNQAQVTTPNLNASNGVVHVINSVLLPTITVIDVAFSRGYTTLVNAVSQEDLLPALTDPFSTLTVFAPTNEAFEAIATALKTNINGLLALPNLKDILLYHVLGSKVLSTAVTNGLVASPLSTTNTLKFTKTKDGKVFVNQAQVTTADINATNGVIHVINSVVLPAKTVVDVALDNGFTTLAKAVIQEELLPALTNPLSTLTVFAPTDAAFSAAAAALNTDINGLLALPNLKSILLYHVLGSKITSSQLINGQVVTLSGEELTVNTTNGVKIENATVTTADVLASNGVVHVVDKVLLPPTVSGISDKKVTTFALYPNPAVDLISTDNYLGYVYQIYNTQGSLQEAGIAKETINISQLPTGSYIIKLSNEGTTVSSKFNKN